MTKLRKSGAEGPQVSNKTAEHMSTVYSIVLACYTGVISIWTNT